MEFFNWYLVFGIGILEFVFGILVFGMLILDILELVFWSLVFWIWYFGFGILNWYFEIGILDGCAKVRANYWLRSLLLFADKLTN